MTPYTLGYLSMFFWLAFVIPTLIFLLRSYGRTRMSGFLWLIVAVVVWPFLARLVSVFLPMIASATGLASHVFGMQHVSIYSLIFVVETLIAGALLLIAVIKLDSELAARMEPLQPSAPPVPARMNQA